MCFNVSNKPFHEEENKFKIHYHILKFDFYFIDKKW